mmetsp:Transcript_32118/g.68768  ORF Transcript_32118/g.68768 Transcript_32118/m.68768 type:complete len:201 (-) Transcript_32118:2313-2915(-)
MPIRAGKGRALGFLVTADLVAGVEAETIRAENCVVVLFVGVVCGAGHQGAVARTHTARRGVSVHALGEAARHVAGVVDVSETNGTLEGTALREAVATQLHICITAFIAIAIELVHVAGVHRPSRTFCLSTGGSFLAAGIEGSGRAVVVDALNLGSILPWQIAVGAGGGSAVASIDATLQRIHRCAAVGAAEVLVGLGPQY